MATDPIRQAQIGTGTSAVTYNIGTSLTSSSNADVAAQGHTHSAAATASGSRITAVTYVSFTNGVLTISTDSVAKGDHTHSVSATSTTKVTAAKSDHTH